MNDFIVGYIALRIAEWLIFELFYFFSNGR